MMFSYEPEEGFWLTLLRLAGSAQENVVRRETLAAPPYSARVLPL
jgi:hypothetical protein